MRQLPFEVVERVIKIILNVCINWDVAVSKIILKKYLPNGVLSHHNKHFPLQLNIFFFFFIKWWERRNESPNIGVCLQSLSTKIVSSTSVTLENILQKCSISLHFFFFELFKRLKSTTSRGRKDIFQQSQVNR